MSQPSPLLAVRQRAEALAGSADLAAAIMLLEDGVDAGKSRLGEDDPEVLTTAHQLARVHLRADDPSAARRVLEEAYAAGQWRLGDTDPLMLEISFDLGVVAEELGNRHEARKAFARVAGTGAAILGADHWAVRRAQTYLETGPSAVRAEHPTEPTASIQSPPTQQPPMRHFPPHQEAQQAPQQATIQRTPTLRHPAQEPPVRYFAPQPPLEAPTEQFVIHQPPGRQQPVQHFPPHQAAPESSTMDVGLSQSDTAQFAAIPPGPSRTTPAHQSAASGQASFTRNATGPSPTGFTDDVGGPSQISFAWDAAGSDHTAFVRGGGIAAGPSTTGRAGEAALGQSAGAPPNDAFTEPTVAQQAIVPVRHTVTPPPPPELLVAVPINAGQVPRYGPRPDSYQRRGSIIFAAIAACLAAIIAVVALVFVLANRGGDGKDDTPVLAGDPPTGVSLDDQGTRIALSWTDPAAGKTTFLVTGGHPGELLKPMGQTGPGTTQYALDGLNVKLEYCFAIVAVYSTSQFATSPQVCTSRPAQPTK